MPTYTYRCRQCGEAIEKSQPHSEMLLDAERLRCAVCEGRMQHIFGVPGIITDTTFTRTMGDGLGNDEFRRRRAYATARRAGVNPNGKIYCPGLCAPGHMYDPKAWVSASNARAEIRKRCEELNYGCEGDVTVKQREPERDPDEGPYTVAPDIVQKKVDKIIETEYAGCIGPKKKAELTEATAERLAGNQ